MTRDEFNAWLQYHRASFAGLIIDEPTAAVWWEDLAGYEYEDCREATKEMRRLPDKLWPSDHLPKLRAIIQRNKHEFKLREPQRLTRDETYRCLKCRDCGYGYVRYRKSNHDYVGMARCDCAAGDRKSQNFGRQVANVAYYREDAKFPQVGSEWNPDDHMESYYAMENQ